jgi:hypothetical protein
MCGKFQPVSQPLEAFLAGERVSVVRRMKTLVQETDSAVLKPNTAVLASHHLATQREGFRRAACVGSTPLEHLSQNTECE